MLTARSSGFVASTTIPPKTNPQRRPGCHRCVRTPKPWYKCIQVTPLSTTTGTGTGSACR